MWSTPGGLSLALKKKGHHLDRFDLKKIDELKTVQTNHHRYDAVVLWEAGEVKQDVLALWKKENFSNTLMVAESGDDPQIFQYNLTHTLPADVVLTPDAHCRDLYEFNGKKAYWFTHWGDESVWLRSEPRDTGAVSSTAGPRKGQWKNCMHALIENLGEKFVNPRLKGGDYISPKQNSDLYENCDVVVQVSSSGEITRRLFEASICERVVVADRLEAKRRLSDCLVENEHIVLYDSPQECIEKVKMLLSNSELRKKISKNAYKHVLKFHSTDSRASLLQKIIEENK